MKITSLLIAAFFAVFISHSALHAQTPSDAIMMNAKTACALLDYNQGSFDQYWEGSLLRKNQTIATVTRTTVMPMVAVGILDKLNFYIGVPYIKTESSEPNGGKFAGVSGLQDLTVALKYKAFSKETKSGAFSALATVGFSTPISNYLSDYMPYSLGLGAPEISYRAILQYKFNNGIYMRADGAYLWRGYTEAEREYYYNNGSYYTPWMDVPNALTFEGVAGVWLWNNSFQVQLSYFSSRSTSGDDIRAYNAAQPTNKIEMDQAGIFAHYYFLKGKKLGVVAYHNRTLQGRNTAKINTTGVGLTYVFNYLKK